MEFLVVKYSRRRTVIVDGEEGGFTNTTLRLNRGTHIITLSDPQNFVPAEIRVRLDGTRPDGPAIVTFTKI